MLRSDRHDCYNFDAWVDDVDMESFDLVDHIGGGDRAAHEASGGAGDGEE